MHHTMTIECSIQYPACLVSDEILAKMFMGFPCHLVIEEVCFWAQQSFHKPKHFGAKEHLTCPSAAWPC